MTDHFVSLMIAFPFVGAILLILGLGLGTTTESSFGRARWIALIGSLLSSALGISLISMLKGVSSSPQFYSKFSWVGSYAITYHVGLDGLNALLVLLISIVFPSLILSAWSEKSGSRGIHSLLLVLQTTLLGAVCAQDLFLIAFFWAMSSLPFYFLMVVWGGKEREKAAFQYIVTASVGNMFLFGVLVLVYFSVEPHSFSLQSLLGGDQLREANMAFSGRNIRISGVAFWLLFLAIGFRMPIWPFHGWYSFFIRQAPTCVGVATCGVFIPISIYLFARLSYSLFPDQFVYYSNFILIVGGVNVLVGALSAVAQKELRPFFAFVGIFQVGILMMGIGSLNSLGFVGATYQGLSVGLGLSGFGLLLGLFINRTGLSTFEKNGGFWGIASSAPVMAVVTGLLMCSLIGFPGLGGFVGQSLIMMGGFSVSSFAILILGLGILLLTFGLFSVFRNVFLGEPTHTFEKVKDLSQIEKFYLFPFVLGVIFIGVYPKPLLDLVRPSVLTLLSVIK